MQRSSSPAQLWIFLYLQLFTKFRSQSQFQNIPVQEVLTPEYTTLPFS